MKFNSTIFILPGLGNSGEYHWQTRWERQFNFTRIQQSDWETPNCEDWIVTLDEEIANHPLDQVILVGHSLACTTVAFWAGKYKRKIKGAMLVAPSDTEADSYPLGTTGFTPVPVVQLPFPTITVASTNDYYVSLQRALYFAAGWGSELVAISDAGHINVDSGFGEWEGGLEILKRLDTR